METKRKIIDTAFELFAEKGTEFSLNQVGEIVGIRKASIYAHFQNKDMLLREVIEEEIGLYFFEINQENDDLEKIFFSVLEYYHESKSKLLFWKRLLLLPPETIEADLTDRIQRMSERRYELVKHLVEKGIQRGYYKGESSDEIALMFFSLLHGLLSSVLIYHPQDIGQHYSGIWNLFKSSITNDIRR